LIDDAEDRPAFFHQPDQHAPAWQAGNEGACSVDRVEIPGQAGFSGAGAVLLALDAVVRTLGSDDLAHHTLGGAIGLGYRIEAGLKLVVGIAGGSRAENRKDCGSRSVGKTGSQRQKRAGEGGVRHGSDLCLSSPGLARQSPASRR
jgi:hypothetical protein